MKKQIHMLDVYIIFCLLVLLVYIAVNLVIFKESFQEPTALTTCVFGAFGGEFLTCGLIKIFKIRHTNENKNDGDTDG